MPNTTSPDPIFWVEIIDPAHTMRALKLPVTPDTPVFDAVRKFCKAFKLKLGDWRFEYDAKDIPLFDWDGFPSSCALRDLGLTSTPTRSIWALPVKRDRTSIKRSASTAKFAAVHEDLAEGGRKVARTLVPPSSAGGLSQDFSPSSRATERSESAKPAMNTFDIQVEYTDGHGVNHTSVIQVKRTTTLSKILDAVKKGFGLKKGVPSSDALELLNSSRKELSRFQTVEQAKITEGDRLTLEYSLPPAAVPVLARRYRSLSHASSAEAAEAEYAY